MGDSKQETACLISAPKSSHTRAPRPRSNAALEREATGPAELHALLPRHAAGHETSIGEMFDQRLEHDARLHPRERRAHAEVHAVAEGKMVDLRATDFERLWVFDIGKVAVGGADDLEDHFVFGEFHAVKRVRLFHAAEISLLGRLVAQGFLDGRVYERGVGFERGPLLGVREE